jgi:hypothetical protein
MTRPVKSFTRAEMEVVAEKAAEKAAEKTVHRLFANLDINMSDFDDVRAFRDNQRFLTAQRQGQEQWKKSIQENKIVLMFSAAVGAVWLFWDIIKAGVNALWSH